MLPLVSMSNGEAGASVYVSASPSASVAATVPTAVPAALFSATVSAVGAVSGKAGTATPVASSVLTTWLVLPCVGVYQNPAPSEVFARSPNWYPVSGVSPVTLTVKRCGSLPATSVPVPTSDTTVQAPAPGSNAPKTDMVPAWYLTS